MSFVNYLQVKYIHNSEFPDKLALLVNLPDFITEATKHCKTIVMITSFNLASLGQSLSQNI